MSMLIMDVGPKWVEWGSGHYVVTHGVQYEVECYGGKRTLATADIGDEMADLIDENGEALPVEMIRTAPSPTESTE